MDLDIQLMVFVSRCSMLLSNFALYPAHVYIQIGHGWGSVEILLVFRKATLLQHDKVLISPGPAQTV